MWLRHRPRHGRWAHQGLRNGRLGCAAARLLGLRQALRTDAEPALDPPTACSGVLRCATYGTTHRFAPAFPAFSALSSRPA